MEKLVPATTAYKWWNCYDYLQNTSRPRLRLLLSGDVQQSPGPTTKYPCSVCTRNVTSRGVSYQCNNCKNWVHAKCSKLQSTNEYRRDKKWLATHVQRWRTKTSASTLHPQAKKDALFTIQRKRHREQVYVT